MNNTLSTPVSSTKGFRSVDDSEFNVDVGSEVLTTRAVDRVCTTSDQSTDPDVTSAATFHQGSDSVLAQNFDNAAPHSRRVDLDPQADGRRSAQELDKVRPSVPHPGAQGPLGRGEPRHLGQDNPGGVEQRAAQGSQAQDDSGRVLHGRAGDEAQRQRSDEQDGDASDGDHHEEVPGRNRASAST